MNKEVIFKEKLEELVEVFGLENQEGIKMALRYVQEEFGFVSKAHQNQIAESFEVKNTIITVLMKLIPNLKEDLVEKEVICCSGPRCSKNGSFEVIKAVKDGLDMDFGEVSKDKKIRLTTQNCFKNCKNGPNIMVNGKFHERMTKEKAKILVEELKK